MAGRLTGRDRKEAERLGLRAETAEETADNLRALELLDAQLANIGCYPELMAQCRAWDGETPIDIVGWTLDGARDDVQELKREKNMSDAEWELEQQRRAAENDTLTGSLFGDGGSFSIATESAQRVEPTPKEAFTRMDVDGPGMSSAEYGKLSKEERDEQGDKYALLPQDEKERIATPGLNAVYVKAAEAQEDFRKIVEGVGAKLGLKVMMRTGLKGRERAMQKTVSDNYGDAGQLLDVFGGTLILTKDDDFAAAVEELRRSGVKIARIKNGYKKQDDYGYADIKVNLEMPNGFIGEVILIEDVMNDVKFGIGHKIYEAGRDIQSELDDNEKNPDYDPERRKLATELVEALQRWSTACYTRQTQEVQKARIEETLKAYQRGLAYILHSSREDSEQAALATEGEWINSAGRAQSEESSKSSYNWKTSPERLIPQAPSWSPLVQNLIKSASSALNIENSIDTGGRNVNQENTGSASFSVIGPHARTWDKHADRAFAGRDDGKMRAEIDASQARLKGARTAPRLEQEDIYALLGTLAEGNEQVEQLIKFRDAWDRYLELIRNEAHLTEKEKAELRGMKNWVPDTRKELTELADRVLKELGYDTTITKRSANRVEALRSAALMADVKTLKKYNKYRKDRESKLGDILDYPELFDAYPELREMRVDGDEAQANGSFSPSTRTVSLNKSLFADPDKLRSTLLHEIQHAIQDIEGFAAGSNAAAAGDKAQRIQWAREKLKDYRWDLKQIEAFPEEMKDMDRSALEGARDKLLADYMDFMEGLSRKKRKERREATDEELKKKDELWMSYRDYDSLLSMVESKRKKNAREVIEELKGKIKQTQKQLRGVHGVRQSLSDYELYRRAPGEIESRNVQERRDWTAEQRQATPFNDTLEYPGEAVNFGSFSVAEAKEKKLFDEHGIMHAANGILIDGASFSETMMHASPHWIQGKFRMDKIGSGEGHQSFGSGMYFTESDRVNDKYLRQFEGEEYVYPWKINGKRSIGWEELADVLTEAIGDERAGRFAPVVFVAAWDKFDTGYALENLKKEEEHIRRLIKEEEHARDHEPDYYSPERLELDKKDLQILDKIREWLADKNNKIEYEGEEYYKIPAFNYRVEIDAEENEMLRWDDKMFGESNAAVLERLRNSPDADVRNLIMEIERDREVNREGYPWDGDGGAFYYDLTEKMREKHGLGESRSDIALAQKYASEALLASGIKGHKYADGFTRNKPRSEWLYNAVVYDMDSIRITHVARGNRDWKPYVPRAEEGGASGSSMSVMTYGQWARQALRRRPDELVAGKVLKRFDKWLKMFDTAVGSTNKTLGTGAARLGVIAGLMEATRSVLPPQYQFGRLNVLMSWAAVYAELAETGEVPKSGGVLKGPIFDKFINALEARRDMGMTEQELRDTLASLGAVKLEEALKKVARGCREQLDLFIKDRAREQIENLWKRAYPDKSEKGARKKGKMHAHNYRLAAEMLKAMNMTAAEVNSKLQAKQTELAAPNTTQERADELRTEMGILQTFGAWESLDAEAAEKALDAFRGFIGSGRTEWDMKEEERKARARKKTRRSMLFFDRLSVMSRHYRNKKMLYLILKKYNSTRFDSSISLSGSARSK